MHAPQPNESSFYWPRTCGAIIAFALTTAALASLHGCRAANEGPNFDRASSVHLSGVTLTDAPTPIVSDQPVSLSAAKNEWTNFAVQLTGLPARRTDRKTVAPGAALPGPGAGYALRLETFNLMSASATIGAENYSVFQILNMPIDVNRAGYIRHTGLTAAVRTLPRALLPMAAAAPGRIDLAATRDPATAGAAGAIGGTGAVPSASDPLMLWIDVHIPPEAPAGLYEMNCDVIDSASREPNPKALATVKVRLNVWDFVLPDERHLMMIGPIDWTDLTRLYTEQFEAVTPRLMNRRDKRYEPAIRTLDQLVRLAQDNRVQVVIPRLQPTVKWPPNRRPQVDWTDYDALVAPWLKGDGFRDKIPVGYWPLPATDNLANFDLKSQRDYWSEASAHFDQLDWLTRSAVVIRGGAGRVDSSLSLNISNDAAAILALNQRLRVEVPLEDDQVQFASPANPNLLRPDTANRLITANPGLVFSSPIQNWPADVPRPARWLRTDLTGLNAYVGAGGDERDARLWAWLASVPLPPPALGVQYGPVQSVRWRNTLPNVNAPTDAADPNELVWFYPGSWFGVDGPVPTIQLKWLRRAQQDYEYLYLARQRGETINALVIARLMSKPVELAPNQQPDPTFNLMSGTSDPKAWSDALDLVARRILLREPGKPLDPTLDQQFNLELGRWAEPQERPVTMGRSVQWLPESSRDRLNKIDVRLGIDIYNASDNNSVDNTLEYDGVPSGWHHRPQPIPIAQLATYHVARFNIDASIEPTEIKNTDRNPIQLKFTDGYTHKQSRSKMILPLANCDRREGRLKIDGSLEDWSPDDAIQDGPMVRMFSRPALQKQELQMSSTPSSVYTGWADENFYVAFKLTGLSGADVKSTRNFVAYEFNRAWGEDLCEMVVQPIYADNSAGPLLHIVCKPSSSWVERKMNPQQFVNPWQPIEGTAVRYAATNDGPDWRGELAIPWTAITDDPTKGRPVLLRFNFTQHKAVTGESASWAGPIDFGRDDQFTGALIIREPNNPGMGG